MKVALEIESSSKYRRITQSQVREHFIIEGRNYGTLDNKLLRLN